MTEDEKKLIARAMAAIWTNDKTVYGYSGKIQKNRFGVSPPKGNRWDSPAQIAMALVKTFGIEVEYSAERDKE